MARSFQPLSGLPHPLAMAAVAAIAGATLFGGDERGFILPGAGPEPVALGAADRMLAPDAPLQERLDRGARAPVDLGGGFVAEPSHAFAVEAVVLSRHPYRFGPEAAVSPLDFTLGWGPMSNPSVLAHLDVRQRGRFGHVRARSDAPLDLGQLGRYWSNVHLVPVDDDVAATLDGIGAGRVVRLTGTLANVSGPDGFTWRTSTSRTDRGNGACEILLVAAVEILR